MALTDLEIEDGLKNLVAQAVEIIDGEKFTATITSKIGNDGEANDLVTSADLNAQKHYVVGFQKLLPGYGIICEEGYNSDSDSENRVTGDPLDGTSAFKRLQSHGIGTMIAMLRNNMVRASYIGDVCTGEIYGFGPESQDVWRYQRELKTPINLSLVKQKASLKEVMLIVLSTQSIFNHPGDKLWQQFKNFETWSGSIGICMARLWKGEVGGVLIPPTYHTPWDDTPVVAISQQLGYDHLIWSTEEEKWVVYHPPIYRNVTKVDHEILVIHPSLAGQLI